MGRFHRAHLALGLGVVAVALLVALVWVPLDSGSGLIEKVRRQVTIGDGLAPTLAAGFLLLGGLLVVIFETEETARGLERRNVIFIAVLMAILIVSFGIMRWAGPALGAVLTEGGYRPLRAEVPWKYIGFILGGVVMIAGVIGFVERRLTLRGVLIGLGASLALIVLYDLPFDDLLLPPNGDV